MKTKLLLIFCFLGWAAFGQSGLTDVPKEIQDAFAKEYPDAKVKNWEKKDVNFVANTKIDGQTAMVVYSPEGQSIETIYAINEKELPGRISTYMSTNYGQFRISLCQYIENRKNGAYYYLQIKKEGLAQETLAEFFFDVSGAFLKKNEFFPISQALSSSAKIEDQKRTKEEKEKLEADNKRKALLKKDRSVKEDDLPEAVQKSFTKKYPKILEVNKWDTLDKFYYAYYADNGADMKAQFSPSGEWVYTAEELQRDQLPVPVEKYLEENYSGMKARVIEKTARKDKKDGFFVELADKPKKDEEPAVSKVYFDKAGKFVRAEGAPPRPKEVTQVAATEPQKVKVVEEEEKVKEKAPDKETKQAEKKVEKPKKPVKEEAEESDEDVKPKKKGKKASDDEEEIAPPVKVPALVSKNFSKRFPRAEEVVWRQEENKYIVDFVQKELKNTMEFSPDGIIQLVKEEVNPDIMLASMRKYIEDKYPNHKIKAASKVTPKDKKKAYFAIEIFTKKKKIRPQEATLYFDKSGRYMEDPPAEN
jgi:hypothetical protein